METDLPWPNQLRRLQTKFEAFKSTATWYNPKEHFRATENNQNNIEWKSLMKCRLCKFSFCFSLHCHKGKWFLNYNTSIVSSALSVCACRYHSENDFDLPAELDIILITNSRCSQNKSTYFVGYWKANKMKYVISSAIVLASHRRHLNHWCVETRALL